MTDDPTRPEAADDGMAPSRVGAAMLGVLAILPTLALALLTPAMLKETAAGTMPPLQLAASVAAAVLLPAGVALLFFRHRAALAGFVLAALAGLVATPGPFGRVAACAVIVAIVGAVMARLQRRL